MLGLANFGVCASPHHTTSLRIVDGTWRRPNLVSGNLDRQRPCGTVPNTRTIHVAAPAHRLRGTSCPLFSTANTPCRHEDPRRHPARAPRCHRGRRRRRARQVPGRGDDRQFRDAGRGHPFARRHRQRIPVAPRVCWLTRASRCCRAPASTATRSPCCARSSRRMPPSKASGIPSRCAWGRTAC